MRGAWLLGLSLLAAACGEDILRPLEIEVLGLSARAESMQLALFPDASLRCSDVSLATVAGLSAPYVERWERASGAERRMSFPNIETEQLTIVGHSENAAGQAIQFGCRELSFNDIAAAPFGQIELNLSQRVDP